jgi:hypothetical protein
MTDRFNLTGGLRYDYDENYKGNLSPRLYGVYSFNDNLTLKGGVSTDINNLTFVQQRKVSIASQVVVLQHLQDAVSFVPIQSLIQKAVYLPNLGLTGKMIIFEHH